MQNDRKILLNTFARLHRRTPLRPAAMGLLLSTALFCGLLTQPAIGQLRIGQVLAGHVLRVGQVLAPAAITAQQPAQSVEPPEQTEPPPQTEDPKPDLTDTSAEPAAIEEPVVTVEAVQALIKQTEEDTALDEAVKTRLLDLYRQTAERLKKAGEWATRAAELDKARVDAPSRMQEIRTRLATPAAELKPDVPPDASLQQLEQLLAQQEAELRSVQTRVTELDNERKNRSDRRLKIPEETAAARQRLEEVNRELAAAPPEDEPPAVTRARRMLLQARKRGIELEISTYEKEILSYDARGDLLTARRDLAARELAQLDGLVRAWRELIGERRRTEAARVAADAAREARQAFRQHPVLHELATENAALAETRAIRQLADKIEHTVRKLEETRTERTSIADEFRGLTGKVEVAGLTSAMGLLLRNRLERLPNLRQHEQNIKARQSLLSDVQVELFELGDQRWGLSNIEPHVAEILGRLDTTVTTEQRDEIAARARELLQDRRRYLDSLIRDYESYLNSLVDLDNEERQLIAEVENFARYIHEHILWTRSTWTPQWADFGRTLDALSWVLNPDHWAKTARDIGGTIRSSPLQVVPGLIVVLALLVTRRRMLRHLHHLGDKAATGFCATMHCTLNALMLTFLLAAPWPLLMAMLAWWINMPLEASEFSKAVATGLLGSASLYFSAEFVRLMCRPRGLGECHFDWPSRACRLFRLNLLWLMALLLPVVFMVRMIDWQGDEQHVASLGRFLFIVIQLAIAVFAERLLRPHGGLFEEALKRDPGSWLCRTRFLWYPASFLIPILLAGLATAGFLYSAEQLALRIRSTKWLVMALIVVHFLMLRWLLVVRRRLAMEQYRQRRAAALAAAKEKEKADGSAPTESTMPEQAEPGIDLSAISGQTRNLAASFVGLTLVLGLWFVWVDVLPALRILDTIVLWQTTTPGATGDVLKPITLANVGLALLTLLMTIIAGRNIPGLLEITILQRLPLPPGGRYAITTVSRYIITIIGLVLTFSAIGIGWSKVQWLAAAITVGLGFGLQEIFANFVSGLIILIERPIRVGDIVTVGEIEGRVTRIRIRATTITDWNRRELIVPNKEFITGQVINWTLTDGVTRVLFPVGIAYGSDTALATQLLLKVARDNPLVMNDPGPSAVFHGFGDSSLSFTLRVFLANRDNWADLVHQIHTEIDRAFRKAGIEIPFPQRDLHLRTMQPIPGLSPESAAARISDDD